MFVPILKKRLFLAMVVFQLCFVCLQVFVFYPCLAVHETDTLRFRANDEQVANIPGSRVVEAQPQPDSEPQAEAAATKLNQDPHNGMKDAPEEVNQASSSDSSKWYILLSFF